MSAHEGESVMANWRFDLVAAPAPGTLQRGNVAWGDPVIAGWDWPYVAVNGAEPGPAVVVTAGFHGSEYPSIDAVVRLGATLDPRTVKGQVLCLPLMNPAAFWERTAYLTPVDGLNLNRVFPGKPKGRFSERIAHLLFERAIRGADAYVDLHGGDLPEGLLPFSIYFESGDAAVDAKSRALAEAFGSPHMICQREREVPVVGQAFTVASKLGVPSMIAEDGEAGMYQAEASDRMLHGLENVLRSLAVLPGGAHKAPAPREFARFAYLTAPASGFFKPEAKLGDEIAVGQRLGRLTDLFGATVADVTAPVKGRLLYLIVNPVITKDALIGGIAVDRT
jgi:predicted deacylase